MNILVAEDDPTSALLLEKILTKGGYSATLAKDGSEALAMMRREPFEALLTDWMMPKIDGIELIRRLRASQKTVLPVIVITALDSEKARLHALNSGADDFIAKPIVSKEVLACLGKCLARQRQPKPFCPTLAPVEFLSPPPFVGVFIAASTGGPAAVSQVVRDLKMSQSASYFLVLHAPVWMLETFVPRLQQETKLHVSLAKDGVIAKPGEIYLAPGDHHLKIRPGSFKLELLDTPPENYVRPSADPLFRSAAEAFGPYCLAVVMTGMGRDGTLGAAAVAAAAGCVLVQDPGTSVAPSMPKTVIDLGIAHSVAPLEQLADAISEIQTKLFLKLRQKTKSGFPFSKG